MSNVSHVTQSASRLCPRHSSTTPVGSSSAQLPRCPPSATPHHQAQYKVNHTDTRVVHREFAHKGVPTSTVSSLQCLECSTVRLPHLTPLAHTSLFSLVSIRTSGVPICFCANFLIAAMARGARLLNPLHRETRTTRLNT